MRFSTSETTTRASIAGFLQDRVEQRLVDVVGTAAGDEMAPSLEQLQRPQVDFLVAGRGALDRGPVARERRRIEHDRLKALAGDLELAQLVEDVALARIEVGDPVARRGLTSRGHRRRRRVDRQRRESQCGAICSANPPR